METETTRFFVPRNILFAVICTVALILNWAAMRNLLSLSLNVDEYSHTIVIPLLTAALIFNERKKIFKDVHYSFGVGIGMIIAAVTVGVLFGASVPGAGQNGTFALRIMSLVLVWMGAFILCYGGKAFRAGEFALLFLLLTIPIPNVLLGKVIYFVRSGSGAVASFAFALFGVPVFRQGFKFMLSDVTIRIATECSGIHSTMALLIVSLIAGHWFLRSKLKRTLLVLIALPVVCFSNGVRITTLTLLSIYVNKGFLYGRLHHEGGFIFFALALVIMWGVLHLMGFRLRPPRRKTRHSVSPSILPAGK